MTRLRISTSAVIVFAAAFWLAGPQEAAATKGCWCWIGIERGQVLIDYGAVIQLKETESNKKAKCSQACSQKCSADINNFALLCSKLGKSYSGGDIGCFSVVGAKDNPNNTWDYDGRPSNFPGCVSTCDCPRGWFDPNRNSCVIGACDVPGMPNGDKGGGYFAWDQKLFLNIPGKTNCHVVPVGTDPNKCTWTEWLNRDTPGGTGDFETLADFVRAGKACTSPKKIECQTVGGQPASSTGQPYTCDPKIGGVCDNRKLRPGQTCQDYKVRFCC